MNSAPLSESSPSSSKGSRSRICCSASKTQTWALFRTALIASADHYRLWPALPELSLPALWLAEALFAKDIPGLVFRVYPFKGWF